MIFIGIVNRIKLLFISLSDPHILIPPTDTHFKYGTYIVGVYCHVNEAKYSLYVNRFCVPNSDSKSLDVFNTYF